MESDDRGPEETLEDEGPPVEEMVAHQMLRSEVGTILASLSTRESRVLELRFGLHDGQPRTLESTAQRFGLTKERIRQIEGEALRKLRQSKNSTPLREYLA